MLPKRCGVRVVGAPRSCPGRMGTGGTGHGPVQEPSEQEQCPCWAEHEQRPFEAQPCLQLRRPKYQREGQPRICLLPGLAKALWSTGCLFPLSFYFYRFHFGFDSGKFTDRLLHFNSMAFLSCGRHISKYHIYQKVCAKTRARITLLMVPPITTTAINLSGTFHARVWKRGVGTVAPNWGPVPPLPVAAAQLGSLVGPPLPSPGGHISPSYNFKSEQHFNKSR